MDCFGRGLLHHKCFLCLFLTQLIFFPLVCLAETLSFSQVLTEGLHSSRRLVAEEERILAARFAVDEAKADNYPQLLLRFGQEYVHVYEPSVVAVSAGDTVFSDSVSKYKHFLTLSAQYNLYDFGRRRLSILASEQQVRLAEFQKQQAELELKSTLVQLYARAMKLYQNIQTHGMSLAYRNKIVQLATKLNIAGVYGREQVLIAAMDLAEEFSSLEEARLDFQETLNSISKITQKNYDAETVELQSFQPIELPDSGSTFLERHPGIAILQQRINIKEAELKIAQRTLLPQLSLSGSYRMYGSDDNSYLDSLDAMTKQDARVTLYFSLPLFDGFASRAKQNRLTHEIASLRYEQQQKQADLLNDWSTLQNSVQAYEQIKTEGLLQQQRIEQQASDVSRLSTQQMSDQINLTEKKLELDRRQLRLQEQEIDSAATRLLLSFMVEAGS